MRGFHCFIVLIVLEFACSIEFVDNQIIESQKRSKRNHEDSHYTKKGNAVGRTNKVNDFHDVSNTISPKKMSQNSRHHVSKPKKKQKRIKTHRKRPLVRMLPSNVPKMNNSTQKINDTISVAMKELPFEAIINQDKSIEELPNNVISLDDTKPCDDGKVHSKKEMILELPNEDMVEHSDQSSNLGMIVNSKIGNIENKVDATHVEIEKPEPKLHIMPLIYSNAVKTNEVKKQFDKEPSDEFKDTSNTRNADQNEENPDLNNCIQIENITSQEYSEKRSPYCGYYNEYLKNPNTNFKFLENSHIQQPLYLVDCNAPYNHNGFDNRVYYPTEVLSNVGSNIIPFQYQQEVYKTSRCPNNLYDRTWKKTQRIKYLIVNNKPKLKRFPRSKLKKNKRLCNP